MSDVIEIDSRGNKLPPRDSMLNNMFGRPRYDDEPAPEDIREVLDEAKGIAPKPQTLNPLEQTNKLLSEILYLLSNGLYVFVENKDGTRTAYPILPEIAKKMAEITELKKFQLKDEISEEEEPEQPEKAEDKLDKIIGGAKKK